MPEIISSESPNPLSKADLESFIAQHLPAWRQACAADDGESIVLHETAFGTSTHELFLFGCAIKYAAAKGKHVHVVSGTGRTKHDPETALPGVTLGSIFREDSAGKRRTHVARRGMKRKKLQG